MREESPKIESIDRPVFIIGTGRSGSTILHQVLSEHEHVAWLSGRLGKRYPHRPQWNGRLMQLIDIPVIGPLARRRYKPAECYPFWDYHRPGFSRPFRDLLAADITPKQADALQTAFSRILTQRHNRLLLKITGWPRIGFLNEAFSEALFVHLQRDPRAVINSLIHVDWWNGWQGPDNWRWGPLTPQLEAEWEARDRSFIALAGIQIKILEQAMRQARNKLPVQRFYTLNYEDLCENPLGTLRDVSQFCGLDWTPKFERKIAQFKLRSQNHRWREDLTIEQQAVVDQIACEIESRR